MTPRFYHPTIAHPQHTLRPMDVSDPILQRYLSDLASLNPMPDDEYQAVVKMLPATEAKQKLVETNLRIVIATAKLFADRNVELQDLIQEGNLGLLAAIERFDPAYGVRFTTYALWWIHQAMQRAVWMDRTIQVPFNDVFMRNVRRLRAETDLQGILGKVPNEEQVAARMTISVEELAALKRHVHASTTVPIEVIADEEDERSSGSQNMRRASMVADAALVNHDPIEQKSIHVALSQLAPKQDLVLRLRFGFLGDREWTLHEVGRIFGYSREAMRQVERDGLAGLRQALSRPSRRGAAPQSDVGEWFAKSCGWCRGALGTARQAGPFCSPMCDHLWWRRRRVGSMTKRVVAR